MSEAHKPVGSTGERTDSRMARWSDDRARALIIAVTGIASIVALFLIATVTTTDDQIFGTAITAVTTLAAAAGGHAAGSSKRQ